MTDFEAEARKILNNTKLWTHDPLGGFVLDLNVASEQLTALHKKTLKDALEKLEAKIWEVDGKAPHVLSPDELRGIIHDEIERLGE